MQAQQAGDKLFLISNFNFTLELRERS